MKKKITVKKQGENKILSEQDVSDESIITVGNNPSATLELKDSQIAPEQFVIISENGQILLMNRSAGTVINGEKLELGSKIELKDDDNIEIGKFELFLRDSKEKFLEETKQTIISSEENIAVVPKESKKNGKDFSTVLNNLKEEDSFYFQIINSENIIERVLFDSEDIWLGTSFAECSIKKSKTELDEIYAYVKKDWSGAVIYPEDSEETLLNGEVLKEPRRLKNEDELILFDDFAEENDIPTKITFHEPVVLLALNSILPEDLPEPISLKSEEPNVSDSSLKNDPKLFEFNKQHTDSKDNSKKRKKKKRRIFGYFSFSEILIMAFGTLVTAAIIFLVLELV